MTIARSSAAPRLEDARRVDEHDLRVVVRGDAAHDGARRLHLVRDDRHLGADQPVDQRRLAGVGRADQRDEAGAGRGGAGGRSSLMRASSRFQHAFAHQDGRRGRLLGLALGAADAGRRLEAGDADADGEERIVIGAFAARRSDRPATTPPA